MTATSESSRIAPPNKFEDYILTYEVGPNAGLYPVSNSAMTYLESGGGGAPGEPFSDDSFAYVNIGFTFKFDQKEYRRIFVTTNGWAVLVDVTSDSGSSGTVITQVLSGFSYENETILDSFSTTKHILLCPWFDDMRNVVREANSSVSAYLAASQVTIEELKYGKKIAPPGIDPSAGGMKYFRGQTRERGKCLVVRWKSFARYIGQYNIVNFDLVLYESGDIEFRYAPRILLKKDTNEGATIGIFANGESVSQPRYRDMSIFLRENDPRGNYENGGAKYNGTYTDPDDVANPKYCTTLNTFSNWPGLGTFGAIFKLSPPPLKKRQLRSIIPLRSVVSFVDKEYSAFDDRNTVLFNTQTVEYPSMLPVGMKVDNEVQQPQAIARMFQSGSIRVSRIVKPGLYDSVMSDSMTEEKVKF